MRVLYVNNSDLPGRVFNGYDLHLELNNRGICANFLVMNKYSEIDTVNCIPHDELEREGIAWEEEHHCVKNVFFPYAENLLQHKDFKNADIVHYHFPYHNMFSLFDYERIMCGRVVWTIHDMWPLTGNCTNPFECVKWQNECYECERYDDYYFPMKRDNTRLMWNIKKTSYEKINPHIVVSSKYMERYIKKSPLTKHFTNIHIIPFGVRTYDVKKKKNKRIVIGFRMDNAEIKGCKYLFDALRRLKEYKDHITVQCVGAGDVPKDIEQQYDVISYGWLNDEEKMREIMSGWDIFVMPSLGESFGMMALEAMACRCAVICFENTVVSEIVDAPKCGITAKYKDSIDLAIKIELLLENMSLMREYQESGYIHVCKNYSFDKYVNEHVELYKKIMHEGMI